MPAQRLRVTSLIVLTVLGVALFGDAPASAIRPQQSPGGLFIDAPAQLARDRSADQTEMRSRVVTINQAVLQDARAADTRFGPPTLLLNLFDDVSYTAVLDGIETTAHGFTWIGHIPGIDLSTVTLATTNGIMAGSIIMPGAVFAIRNAGGVIHEISQIDQSKFPPEGEPIAVSMPGRDWPPVAASPFTSADDGSQIDVMVLYTAAAEAAAGGPVAIETRIRLGIGETNTSYVNSGVTQRLRLVYTDKVTYTENNDLQQDLDTLSNFGGSTTLGDTAASLRNTYGADLVMLLTSPPSANYCGLAYVMDPVSTGFEQFGFSVVEQSCISPNGVFAHELGHNMGARHDWYVDNGTTPYTYAHGYVNTAGQWRTIMAYNNVCAVQSLDCTRLLYWSNPGVSYNSAPMGIAGGTKSDCATGDAINVGCDADDHRTLNNTALTVANFRTAVSAPLITTVAGTGVIGFGGDGGPATEAQLATPSGVAVDGAGNLYIADLDNRRIRKLAAETGLLTTVAGNGGSGAGGDGGAATAAELASPGGVAVDGVGNLYIPDYLSHRVRKVTAATGLITTVAGTGTAGGGGDGGTATAAQLDHPTNVAVDGAGNLYIADSYNSSIRKVSAATGLITTVAGRTGLPGFSGDGGAATAAQLNYPTGVAVDGAGYLYIADRENHRVRRVIAATGVITTVAGTGVPGFGGNGSAATAAQLSGPAGVAVDEAGNVFIADAGNSRIRKVTAATGVITTVAGTNPGTGGFSGDGGAATAALLNSAYGIAVDGAGSLYIADTQNVRVRQVAPPSAPTISSHPADQSVSVGSTVTFSVTASGYPPPSLQWQVSTNGGLTWTDLANSSPYSGVTTGMLTVAAAPFSLNGHQYRAVATNGVGTATSGAATLVVNAGGGGAFVGPQNGGGWSGQIVAGQLVYRGVSYPLVNGTVTLPDCRTYIVAPTGALFGGTLVPGCTPGGGASPATPVITWATPAAITAGTALSATELNATANVAGTFVYAPPAGTVLAAGTHALTATFTPADTVAYTSATATVTLVVNAGGGGAFVGPQNGGGWSGQIVAGQLVYRGVSYPLVNGAVTLPDCRTYLVAPTGALFGGTLVPGCTPGGGAGPATPVITWAAPAAITAGTALSATQLSATANVAGTLVYAPPAGTVLAAGTYSLTATFTPADTVAYTSATATVTLVVNAGGGGAFVGPQNGGGWSGQIVAGQLVYRGVSYPLVNGTVTLPDCRTYLVAPTGALFGGTPATGCPPASTSVITTVAGTGTSGFGGDGGAATAAQLDAPEGVAVDGAGNLYIADNRNHRIRKLAAATGVITTVVGTAPAGFSGDGGLATAAQLDHPTGSAVDGLGNLYIADNWNHRIRKVTAATGIITTVAGTGTGGFGGDGGASTAAQLYYPYSVAVDGVGNLYIADYYNQRIRKVTAATGIITTVAGTDVGGFSGDGGAATAAQLLYPNGVAVDGAGNLYIADTSNQRVRKVTAATGIITTVAGTGTYGFNGDGGAATAAQLRYPSGLAVDGAGNLYIADWENHRVRLVASATGVITTVAGAGTAAFGGDGAAATRGGLSFPASVAVDNAKTLYIADSGNHRIRKVAPPSAAAISSHPSDQSVSAGSAATFSVAASGYPPPSLQWQVSTNGGLTWTDLAASSPYSGVTSRTLTVAEAPFSLNGYQYRAVATNGVGTATSRAATLVVNAGGGGAFVGPQNGGGWSGQIVAGQLVYRGVSYPLVNGTVTLPDCRTYLVAPTGALFGGTLVPGCTPGGGAGLATPVITWATPAAITAGTALSATQLSATANVPGALVYAPPAGTVLAAGTHALTATFTPADTVAYTSATATVTLGVNAGGGGAFVGPQNGGGWSGQIVAGQLVYRGVSYPLVNGTVTLPDCRTYLVAPTGALFGGTPVLNCTPGSP